MMKGNMQKIEVLPSLLAADFSDLRGQLRKIEAAGCSKLHLDIMDGNFVPNITFGPALIRSIRKISGLFFQAYLMIDRPERYVETFKRAGVDGIIIHEESCCNFRNTLKQVVRAGANELICGEAVFSGDIIKNIKSLSRKANEAA
jgi:ribulose-phosphate 3-epimerase